MSAWKLLQLLQPSGGDNAKPLVAACALPPMPRKNPAHTHDRIPPAWSRTKRRTTVDRPIIPVSLNGRRSRRFVDAGIKSRLHHNPCSDLLGGQCVPTLV